MTVELDVEAFTASLSDEAPCGPNLEYDPDFLALEDLMRVDAGQEFGDAAGGSPIVIEGAGIDWPAVRKQSEALLQRTRDLRVAVSLVRSLLHTEGFAGLLPGLRLIDGLLQTHWNDVHPQLDVEDDNDPTMRVNALAPLVANDALIEDLRSSWLLRSRVAGVLTVRAVELALGRLPALDSDVVLSESQLAGMLGEAVQQYAGLPASISAAIEAVKSISNGLQEQVGASRSIDFKPLEAVLNNCRFAFGQLVPEGQDDHGDGMAGGESADNGQAASAQGFGASGRGGIHSRADVVAALDQLVQYLQRTEPTNPAQMLLRRAQRVMNMSFLEAINELAPDALQQAELMLGERLSSSDD